MLGLARFCYRRESQEAVGLLEEHGFDTRAGPQPHWKTATRIP